MTFICGDVNTYTVNNISAMKNKSFKYVKCFYSGILLELTGERNLTRYSKEHLINKCSNVLNDLDDNTKQINIVPCVRFINSNISGFNIPMKIELYNIFKSTSFMGNTNPKGDMGYFKNYCLSKIEYIKHKWDGSDTYSIRGIKCFKTASNSKAVYLQDLLFSKDVIDLATKYWISTVIENIPLDNLESVCYK